MAEWKEPLTEEEKMARKEQAEKAKAVLRIRISDTAEPDITRGDNALYFEEGGLTGRYVIPFKNGDAICYNKNYLKDLGETEYTLNKDVAERLRDKAFFCTHEEYKDIFLDKSDRYDLLKSGKEFDENDWLYVLGRKKDRFGGSAILDPVIQQKISEYLGDYLIIPYSLCSTLIYTPALLLEKDDPEYKNIFLKDIVKTADYWADRLRDTFNDGNKLGRVTKRTFMYSAEEKRIMPTKEYLMRKLDL